MDDWEKFNETTLPEKEELQLDYRLYAWKKEFLKILK